MTPSEPLSLCSVDTEYSADAVEFAPFGADLFVCGTYQVDKDESQAAYTRRGRCLVYLFGDNDHDGSSFLQEMQRIDGPAILDMKWSSRKEDALLAIADAKGGLAFHQWDSSQNQLLPQQRLQVTDEATLCLSLDWSNRRISSGPAEIVTSLSDGSLSTIGRASDGSMTVLDNWRAHDFEPWIAAFDCWDPNVVWSGGDDCKLKGWDVRMAGSSPTFVNKRTFPDAGVTSMQSHHLVEHLFAVGSYDGRIRFFDTRRPTEPVEEHDVGGGVWRIKWHPSDRDRLVAAAMHNGFHVVTTRAQSAQEGLLRIDGTRTTAHFKAHESLAYGVDWCERGDGKTTVASCSFYDHVLHTWTV